MREWLEIFIQTAVVVIDAMAAVLIVIGTVEAFISAFLVITKPSPAKREVWLRYARWLVGALTFQLAADVLETSVRMSWPALAQLAVVAVVRTFLDYFLERDIRDVREIQNPSPALGHDP